MVKLSAIFNAYPEVLSSQVEFEAHRGRHLPDEQRRDRAALSRQRGDSYAKPAEGQAPDGMLLRDAAAFQALELDQLPSEADMRKAFTAVAEDIQALAKAPAGEGLSGPDAV